MSGSADECLLKVKKRASLSGVKVKSQKRTIMEESFKAFLRANMIPEEVI